MDSDTRAPLSDRAQTDESLRLEREKADHALEVELASIDETADAVISRARARADEVLAAARARTDRQLDPAVEGGKAPVTIARERAVEDQALRQERSEADEVLREERAEKVSLLAVEREETDRDLSSERARSDGMLTTRDEFLGVVSHDLRNMLGAMVGLAALIAKEVARDDHVDRVLVHAERIQRSGKRMNRLIGDLVDVATIEAGALAVVREIGDPSELVTEAVETFQAQAGEKGVRLHAEIASQPSSVAFDPARILQVLTNLLSNAIKFTPSGGSVSVRVEQIADDLRFSVTDTGPGIPADKLDAVFGRFLQIARNDRRGVGLGLYISRCIVQGHGGRIWAESRLGEGSTFSFTLPSGIAV